MTAALKYGRQRVCAGRGYRGIQRTSSAPFSQYTRALESTSPGPKPGSGSHERQQKSQPKGSYTRVFGSFALGIPLGWAVSTYLDDGKPSHTVKPGEFVKYTLAKKEAVSSTCSIFTLKPATSVAIDASALRDGRALSSVQIKQPQLQIARHYTLLPPLEEQQQQEEAKELRFLIRQEQNGEVSGYLHRLPMGAELELRGPNVDYILPERVKKVVFLAGGTGIAPAMQVVGQIGAEAQVHVLWASRRREDCLGGVSDIRSMDTAAGWNVFGWDLAGWWKSSPSPESVPTDAAKSTKCNAIVAQFQALKQRGDGAAKIDYYVDDEGTFIQPAHITRLLRPATPSDDEAAAKVLLVSGPEGFVKYWAGPKQWTSDGEVQGPLGGVLSTLDLRGWQVVKL